MKKLLLVSLLLLNQSLWAQSDALSSKILPIQKQWAHIKYHLNDTDEQAAAYQQLAKEIEGLTSTYPNRAEPLIWQAITLSSYAGSVGGIKSLTRALPAVKKARELLHQAEEIDAGALNGSVYTSLGALYYQVPGWPIGFGDKKRAHHYLKKAMSTSINQLDAGYFLGDFLFRQKDYHQARAVLEKALQSPPLAQREVADQGRREAIITLLRQVNSELDS